MHCDEKSEKFWNIPNALSLYRLLVFPLILFWIFTGREQLVALFIAISLFTDWLDGIIARAFKLQTNIGALLDSWADTGTYLCALPAIYIFKWNAVAPHLLAFELFLAAWVLSYIVVFAKFKGLIGLHTYLFKITGYLQGGFIMLLFLYGFVAWLFYLSMIVGVLACIEEIIIILYLAHPRTNVRGLYWVLKNPSR